MAMNNRPRRNFIAMDFVLDVIAMFFISYVTTVM